MTSRELQLLKTLACATGILGVVMLTKSAYVPEGIKATLSRSPAVAVSSMAAAVIPQEEAPTNGMNGRIALRLRNRLNLLGIPSTHSQLVRAVGERQRLLAHSVHIEVFKDAELHKDWIASAQADPLWIQPDFSTGNGFVLDTKRIATSFSGALMGGLAQPVDSVLTVIEDVNGVLRAQSDGIAKAGYELDEENLLQQIEDSYDQGTSKIAVSLLHRSGSIDNQSSIDLGTLTLLATGESNFKGSGLGRIGNVRKAIRQHVHNTVVAPGEIYSFNKTLNGAVDGSNGWFMAKVIVNGKELVDAPGGGICQASTTVFRAILNAGLPVINRRAHSMYVSYYEAKGIGQDATVMPGQQDLTFLNDTGNYLLIQAYDDGYDLTVNIYGTPDGRTVALQGPYFSTNAPEGLLLNGKEIRSNEIGWKRQVQYLDGRIEEYDVVSRYFGMPRRLLKEYASL